MVEKQTNTAVREYYEIQSERLARGKNARRWFYRGIAVGAVALLAYAKLSNDEDQTEES